MGDIREQGARAGGEYHCKSAVRAHAHDARDLLQSTYISRGGAQAFADGIVDQLVGFSAHIGGKNGGDGTGDDDGTPWTNDLYRAGFKRYSEARRSTNPPEASQAATTGDKRRRQSSSPARPTQSPARAKPGKKTKRGRATSDAKGKGRAKERQPSPITISDEDVEPVAVVKQEAAAGRKGKQATGAPKGKQAAAKSKEKPPVFPYAYPENAETGDVGVRRVPEYVNSALTGLRSAPNVGGTSASCAWASQSATTAWSRAAAATRREEGAFLSGTTGRVTRAVSVGAASVRICR